MAAAAENSGDGVHGFVLLTTPGLTKFNISNKKHSYIEHLQFYVSEINVCESITKKLTPWSRVLLEKLTFNHLVRILHLLWNTKLHDSIYKNLPRDRIRSYMNKVRIVTPHFFRIQGNKDWDIDLIFWF
jgi:hypothetical protein